eukprot:2660021-Pyramimonas_sp.AAC.1
MARGHPLETSPPRTHRRKSRLRHRLKPVGGIQNWRQVSVPQGPLGWPIGGAGPIGIGPPPNTFS